MTAQYFLCSVFLSIQKCHECHCVMETNKNGSEGAKKGQSHDTITLLTLLKVILCDVSCNFKKYQGFSLPISDSFERIAPMTPQQKGGKAVSQKYAPLWPCPYCGKVYPAATPYAWLGHMGLHGLANKYFNGDIKAAQRRLRENGLARQEAGASWINGAFKPYRPVKNETA